jgi:hypothetical protein
MERMQQSKTSLLPWHPNRSPKEEEQEKRWVYMSGVSKGEQNVLDVLLEAPLGRDTI